jgi:hypothetical protein
MDTFENLIERAAPQVDVAALTPELDELGAAFGSMLRPELTLVRARRRRRRQRILTGAAGLAILAGTAPAAAGYLGLHTGVFGTDGNHYGEFLNLGSPAALPLLRHYEEQYPLPAGGTWTVMEGRWTKAASGSAGVGQAGILEEAAGLESQCQWEGSWLAAHASGDRATESRAGQVLAEIPRWHVITAYADSSGGVVQLASQVAEAARLGHPALVQQVFTANCTDVKPGT